MYIVISSSSLVRLGLGDDLKLVGL